MTNRSALALSVLLIAGACSALSIGPPSLVVPLDVNEFGEFELLVYDGTGMVIDGHSTRGSGHGVQRGQVVAHPEGNELEVTWIGGACAARPTLTLGGDLTSVTLTLQPDPPRLQLLPVSCPAIGLYFGVTLTMSGPLDQDSVVLEVI